MLVILRTNKKNYPQCDEDSYLELISLILDSQS